MLFHSSEFIFLFLPLVLLVYYQLTRRGQPQYAFNWLILASLGFYGWWKPEYLFLLTGSIVFNYWVGQQLISMPAGRRYRRLLLFIGISVNLASIGYYKYSNFFIDTINTVSGSNYHLDTIILPLAISFFTFQQIAYLVESYQGQTGETSFRHYTLFVTFFPQLIAGPIVRHKEIIPQFLKNHSSSDISSHLVIGLTIFSLGLFKKVIIADGVAPYSDAVFGMANTGETVYFLEAWAGAVAYSLQLYFDFSGYSDMAIGLARMFGITLPINFNSPYQSASMIDFWKRWHITLSRFLRDYLYFPLGGNRKGSYRRYLNLMITMLLGGLWHGAGWTFVLWGGLHGFYLIINHLWRSLGVAVPDGSRYLSMIGTGLSRLLTLLCIIVAWVYFRAENLDVAHEILTGMAGLHGVLPPGPEPVLGSTVFPIFHDLAILTGSNPETLKPSTLIALYSMIIPVSIVLFFPNTQQLFANKQTIFRSKSLKQLPDDSVYTWHKHHQIWGVVIGMIAAYATFGGVGTSQFLYFNF